MHRALILIVLVILLPALMASQFIVGGDSVGVMPANLYVCGNGNDNNDGLSTGTALLTGTAAIAKIPKLVRTSGVINFCTGSYTETISLVGIRTTQGATVTLQGYINSSANSFTNSATLSGTSSGSNTNNWPAVSASVFNDTTANQFGSAGTQRGRFLHLTAGTGFDASVDDNNWYPIETNTSTSALKVAAKWRGATPDATTTYQIFNPVNMSTIDGGGTRASNLAIYDSTGIIIRSIARTGATFASLYILNSNLNCTSANCRDMFLSVDRANTASGAFAAYIINSRIGKSENYISNGNSNGVYTSYSNTSFLYSMSIGSTAGFGWAPQNFSRFLAADILADGNVGAGSHGIDIDANAEMVLQESRSSNNGTDGILVGSSSTVFLYGNNVFDTVVKGIYLIERGFVLQAGTGTLTISNNTDGIFSDGSFNTCNNCNSATFSGNTNNVNSKDHSKNFFISPAAPTVTAGCGTSPSVAGDDNDMTITVGTGGSATSCTVTFNIPFVTAPRCYANHDGTILFTRAVATTTTVVADASSAFTASGKIGVHCVPY